jgi:hypothetical protein
MSFYNSESVKMAELNLDEFLSSRVPQVSSYNDIFEGLCRIGEEHEAFDKIIETVPETMSTRPNQNPFLEEGAEHGLRKQMSDLQTQLDKLEQSILLPRLQMETLQNQLLLLESKSEANATQTISADKGTSKSLSSEPSPLSRDGSSGKVLNFPPSDNTLGSITDSESWFQSLSQNLEQDHLIMRNKRDCDLTLSQDENYSGLTQTQSEDQQIPDLNHLINYADTQWPNHHSSCDIQSHSQQVINEIRALNQGADYKVQESSPRGDYKIQEQVQQDRRQIYEDSQVRDHQLNPVNHQSHGLLYQGERSWDSQGHDAKQSTGEQQSYGNEHSDSILEDISDSDWDFLTQITDKDLSANGLSNNIESLDFDVLDYDIPSEYENLKGLDTNFLDEVSNLGENNIALAAKNLSVLANSYDNEALHRVDHLTGLEDSGLDNFMDLSSGPNLKEVLEKTKCVEEFAKLRSCSPIETLGETTLKNLIYDCPHCDMQIYSRSSLLAHLRLHHKITDTHCQICDLKSGNSSFKVKHETAHKVLRNSPYLKKTGPRSILCPRCPTGDKTCYASHIELLKHIKFKHENECAHSKCNNCKMMRYPLVSGWEFCEMCGTIGQAVENVGVP